MKKLLAYVLIIVAATSCNESMDKPGTMSSDSTSSTSKSTGSVTLPYTATYSSSFTDNVSDEDLLTVMNSYKLWETGDMKGLRATLGDSISFRAPDGYKFDGTSDSLISRWSKSRDSLSSVSIVMDAWTKHHSTDKNEDFVNVWYKEIDTYKTGKVDSANLHDINMVKNGKIAWYSQYRQVLK